MSSLPVFYSQQGEDVYVFNNYINCSRADGIYLELGALDGVTYSNTKFFRDQLGFRGVLIEPTRNFKQLIVNRPFDQCFNMAVASQESMVTFVGENATAGLVETMHATFRKSWHQHSHEYQVLGTPLRKIIEKSGISYIDLLTIDVEGGELVVLETMDFTIPMYVVVIELDGHNPTKDERCREILRKEGFVCDKRIAINEFWINWNYARRHLLYNPQIPKLSFTKSIREIGDFRYLAPHLISEVEDAIRQTV